MISIRTSIKPVEQNTHPKAIAAQEQARVKQAEAAAILAAKKETIKSLAAEHGLKFIDITPAPFRRTKGMTIAYNGNKVLRMSLVTRNPGDTYSRLEGRLAAAEAFKNGRWIHLRRPADFKPGNFLRQIFSF